MIKKSPYLFFYISKVCIIGTYHDKFELSHDFDKKSDILNYEFSKRLSAITQFKKWSSSKERVGSREDVTSSNQTTQQLDGIIVSKANVGKKHTTKDRK